MDAEPTKPPVYVKKLSPAERIDAMFKASASKPKVPTLTITGLIERLDLSLPQIRRVSTVMSKSLMSSSRQFGGNN
ncbi:MAG: hypothetical protein SGJ27_10785 [Candidatus Melainabacteria bacterium]|nr:hypothetical protein [Candidatus Melainabacteria bacterium]